ncbi:sigma-E factor negative regulatory protein, partial [Porticoccaceae bacterium]|nr:sigma-E factor negative regulatory protein [Porticoccaceae bacterium]
MSQYDENLGESLSAMVDGEAQDLETRRVLKELASNDGANALTIRGKWQRYHAISGVMRGGVVSDVDYSSVISEAIKNEDTLKTNPLRRILSSSGRFAIAASVAVVAIIGVQQFEQSELNVNDTMKFAQIDDKSVSDIVGPVNQVPLGWTLDADVRAVSSEGIAEKQYSEREIRL